MIPLGPVLVLLAQAPATPLPAEGEPIRYQAEQGTSDGHGEVLHLLGKAELRTDTARIQADRIDYDQRTQIVTASGHCYAVSGLSGAVADGLTLDLDANWLKLENGRFFLKADVPPQVLLQTTTPEQLLATGRTTLAARAERVERVDKGHLKIQGLDFTPCDCNPLDPHWSIKATAADVYPGDRAWLFLPVIYVYGVPILPLPVLDVPLKPQKTGLLVTTPAHSAQNGWQVTQPVYFALAPNWDLTVAPGYTWGSGIPPVPNAAVLGVMGPSLDTEVRWVASRETRGDIELFLLDDRLPIRDSRALSYYAPDAWLAAGDVHRPWAAREPERRRGAGARRCVVGPAGPEPGLRRGPGEGHNHRCHPAGQPVPALLPPDLPAAPTTACCPSWSLPGRTPPGVGSRSSRTTPGPIRCRGSMPTRTTRPRPTSPTRIPSMTRIIRMAVGTADNGSAARRRCRTSRPSAWTCRRER